ncbi:MAG TPA: hypothetical protein PK040_02750 [Anaerolineaceae bacterium]|nr:hypothetical protein [Anaerolineaceae bacterium]
MPLNDLLSQFPPEISALVLELRVFLIKRFPELQEEVDLLSRILAYALAAGMPGVAFTIIPSRKAVKLGIPFGSQLQDPFGLLSGNGKLHKVVELHPGDKINPQLEMLADLAYQKAVDRTRKGEKDAG